MDLEDGGVEAVDEVAVEGSWGIGGVERLESDVVVGFEEGAFEGGLVVGQESCEAVGAGRGVGGGREDDDVALAVERGHGVADDTRGEGIGVGEVG